MTERRKWPQERDSLRMEEGFAEEQSKAGGFDSRPQRAGRPEAGTMWSECSLGRMDIVEPWKEVGVGRD